MATTFRALTLSYKTAPINIREAVSLNEGNIRKLLGFARDFISVTDLLIVSTCNRTEVYYSADKDFSAEIIKMIAVEKGGFNSTDVVEYFKVLNDQAEAIQHLFKVSLGLESQVIGDIQISNQIKKSYQYAADANVAGPFLHRLMHTIFAASKRVQQETCFRDGAASVSYATVELAKELTEGMVKPSVLVVGVGEIGSDVAKNLEKAGFGAIKIANRTLEKARLLAENHDFEVVDWKDIQQKISETDVIISAVPGLQSCFTQAAIQDIQIPYQKVFIDLSIPRSIDPSIGEIPGVLLYNVDHIRNKTTETLEKRKAAIKDVETIINEMAGSFGNWQKEAEVTSVITELKDALEDIRQQEMKRYLKNLNENEVEKVDLITRGIIQKIIKLPVLQLKTACQRGDADQLSEVLRTLFDLEKQNKIN
jgi:glutamyl-tRNA reductase